jgi:hypothetical protein
LNNILSSKTNSAIFLAALLVLGTIATILPSTQAQPYYKDIYQPDYPSYSQDYEPEYQSYGKDIYKSKDSSVSINKLKCINNNVNINGNNTGDINVGNSGSSGTSEGYLGVGSFGGNGEDGYDNGYNKQKDKSFSCIINNNNINNNFRAGNSNVTEPLTCEECFERFLTPTELTALDELLIGTLETYCNLIGAGNVEEDDLRFTIEIVIGQAQEEEDRINNIVECLLETGVVFAPPT